MASRIEDYGLIGNTRTAALVSRTGSIDWLCAPRFDSDACFAALVGYDEHGRWSISPRCADARDEAALSRRHPDPRDRVRLRRRRRSHHRLHAARAGTAATWSASSRESRARSRWRCSSIVRFGYGAVRALDHGRRRRRALRRRAGRARARGAGRSSSTSDSRASAFFTVKKGERCPSADLVPVARAARRRRSTSSQALARDRAFWREWAARCTVPGPLRDAVMRSLLTLKALIYAPTGGIVAAPTTSLPEADRRRAQLGLSLLLAARREPDARRADARRLRRRGARRSATGCSAPSPAIPPSCRSCTASAAARRLTEFELAWLPGYEGSKPVRVGNAASGQFQLDVYGEVLSALYAARKHGPRRATEARGRPQSTLIEFLEQRLAAARRRHLGGARRPPALHALEAHGLGGGRPRRAGHRGVRRSAATRGARMLPHLRALRERIHDEVCERGFNPQRRRVHPVVRQRSARRERAAHARTSGFSAGQRSARAGDRRGDREDADARRLRAPLRHRARAPTGCPGPRARSSPAASGWPTTTPSPGASTRRRRCSSGCSAAQPPRPALRGVRPALQRQIGNFPQAFSHLALIFTAHILDATSQKRSPDQPAPVHGAAVFH